MPRSVQYTLLCPSGNIITLCKNEVRRVGLEEILSRETNTSYYSVQFTSVAQLCLTLRPHGPQHARPPSITTSRNLPKLMSIESVMPSNHSSSIVPFSSCLQFFPASGSFQMNQLFTSGGQSIKSDASASVLPVNTQDWFPLGWLDLLAAQGTLKSLLQHHSSKASILWHSAFFIVQLSHPYMTTGKTITLTKWTFVGKGLCFLICCLGWS